MKISNQTLTNDKYGFTLIELLAVIIILGVLMIVAVPSVTKQIESSRKSSYVAVAKGIIGGARLAVNGGSLDITDKDTTYYIESDYIKTENAQKTPYGDLVKSYIIVTCDDYGHTYYFTGVDESGKGVKDIVKGDLLNEDDIIGDIDTDDIKPNVGIGTRSKIIIIKQDGSVENGTLGYSVSEDGGVRQDSSTLISSIMCKRATSLHRISCIDSEFGCEYSEDKEWAFTFGNKTTTNGVLTPGDAFDCDVNNDGNYDSTSERFYYLTSSGNKASLIYHTNYSNVSDNGDTTNYPIAYASQYYYGYTEYDHSEFRDNWHGPVKAFIELPTIGKWKNPNLIAPSTRQIVNEQGGTITDALGFDGGPNTIVQFSYWEAAARFLTYQEVKAACGVNDITVSKSLENCIFLFENTSQVSSSNKACYWLETPSKEYDTVWIINSDSLNATTESVDVETSCTVRPVITVLKTSIEY